MDTGRVSYGILAGVGVSLVGVFHGSEGSATRSAPPD